ncbi:MAG: hypothetical protein SFT92_06210 [Rickettsiales bacterium]|nr:hypothetical protein [Rickettsiales bacterium]
MSLWIDIIGWVGAVLVLAGYFLISFKKLTSDSYSYQAVNIIGALFLATYAYYKDAGASVLVNVVWFFIGVVAVWSLYRGRKKDGQL